MSEQTTKSESALPTGTWALDPTQTNVTITAKKMGFHAVPASLLVRSGSIEVGADGAVSNVEVIVDAASYSSSNAKRDEHVRGADFLDTDTYPTLEFRATSLSPSGTGWRADGLVTVKGQTFPLAVDVTAVKTAGDHPSFTATASIDRHTVGVAKMPNLVISRLLELSVSASTHRSA